MVRVAMEAASLCLDDSLIAVRCAVATPIGISSPEAGADPEEHQPRMCCNDSCLTASGGDFAFPELVRPEKTP